jgi:predicted MFS family arabinose efflux permease
MVSSYILCGVPVNEAPGAKNATFWPALREGLSFVRNHRLLIAMASCVGVWQLCVQAGMAVQILFATRLLGLTGRGVGLSYFALGVGTVTGSALCYRVVRRLGAGPTLVLGIAISGSGWLLLACAPLNRLGVLSYTAMLLSYGIGSMFIFINFMSLRQAVTPTPMLGRMTSTMRWLVLLPAGPGALLGGWLGEHFGLRASLEFAGCTALLLAAIAANVKVIRNVTMLPTL